MAFILSMMVFVPQRERPSICVCMSGGHLSDAGELMTGTMRVVGGHDIDWFELWSVYNRSLRRLKITNLLHNSSHELGCTRRTVW